ncbi:MAG TPA: cyclic nucleotide-binding domain-containing protein [Nitrososphaerales archaeon]|nr:cyclic nucleotide-binding domain-containing protein [Nitrososphaerales archaeon]
MAVTSDAASMLGAVPFFSGLDEKKRKSLVSQGREMSYKAGDFIVREGAMGVGFYLILDGKAEVRKGDRTLATLEKGQFFGEMSLIDELPRSADVVALSLTKCWALTSWAFAGLVKTNPEVALQMLKEMVKRLRAAQSSPTS